MVLVILFKEADCRILLLSSYGSSLGPCYKGARWQEGSPFIASLPADTLTLGLSVSICKLGVTQHSVHSTKPLSSLLKLWHPVHLSPSAPT